MQDFRRVLACVDQSPFADHVADYAAWAALRLDAPLEFLHILDRHPEVATEADHSGAIGIDAREHLLETLAEQDAERSRHAREQGRLFLVGLRERAMAAGVAAPDIRQRHGELQETLVEQEQDVRLFVLGRRGESAVATQRDLGRNIERVVRALHRPILTVTDDFRPPQRAMIAFDGGAVTRRGVSMVAQSPLFRGMSIHLLMSGKPGRDAARQLEWARATLQEAGLETSSALRPGDAETTIARAVLEEAVDLLIMGAFAHGPLRSLFLGSKTLDLLRAASIPVLLLR